MGSEGVFVDTEEAAALLEVTTHTVHKYVERGLLSCHYPGAKKTGGRGERMYHREEVEALAELRSSGLHTSRAALTNQVLVLSVKVKQLETTLSELSCYLGMSACVLPTSQEEVRQFHLEARQIVDLPLDIDDHRDVQWAKRMLPVSEEFLALVQEYTQDHEPWRVFMDSMKRLLAIHGQPGPVNTILEHALLNLRNAAFLYVCSTQGIRATREVFPELTYTGRIFATIQNHVFKDVGGRKPVGRPRKHH